MRIGFDRGRTDMGVKRVGERYRCSVCGNEVTVVKISGDTLVCCNKPMLLVTVD